MKLAYIRVETQEDLNLSLKRKNGEEVRISKNNIILSMDWKRSREENSHVIEVIVDMEGMVEHFPESGDEFYQQGSPRSCYCDWSGERFWNIRGDFFRYSLSEEEKMYLQEKVKKVLTEPLYIGAGGGYSTLRGLEQYRSMIVHHHSDVLLEEIERLGQEGVKSFADQYHFDIAKGILEILFDSYSNREIFTSLNLYIEKKKIEQQEFLLEVEKSLKKAIDKKDIEWPDMSDWEGDSSPHIHFNVDVNGKIYHGILCYDDGNISTSIGSVPDNPLVGYTSAEKGDEEYFEGPIKDWTYISGPSFEYSM
jgi:hypothetical protein